MARDHVDYYYVKWSAFAEINDERVEIAGFHIEYELDELPKAVIHPVVGREPSTDKEAKSFQVILDAQPYSTVKIFVKGEPESEDSPRGKERPGFIFNEEQKVFDGFYQGAAYEASRSPAGGSVRVVGVATGWLSGLVGSSGQTTSNTVKGPGGFAEICNVGIPGFDNPNAIIDTRNAFVAGAGQASSDLWIEFVKPLFQALLDNKTVWGSDDNTSGQDALERMDTAPFGDQDAPNNLPLELETGGVPSEVLGHWVGTNVASRVYSNWRDGTLWSALKRLAFDFKFHIVPLIDTASCCPTFGMLGGEPLVTIEPDEYDQISLKAKTPALITKLVVTGSLGTISSPWAFTPRTSGIIGIFSAEPAWAGVVSAIPIQGQTKQIPAPYWLEAEASIGDFTRESVGGDSNGIPDAVNPGAFAVAPARDYQEIYNNYLTSDMGDRYAEAALKEIMFMPRNGSIGGRFRLDVAPGSTVGVRVIGDKFAQQDTEPQFVFGHVQKVSLDMNAGLVGSTGSARTTFELRHVRTGEEHTGSGGFLTADEHPIYRVRYVGSKLFTE